MPASREFARESYKEWTFSTDESAVLAREAEGLTEMMAEGPAAHGSRTSWAVSVRPLEPSDCDAWVRMRATLWPEESEAVHREEAERFLAGKSLEPLEVLLAELEGSGPIGFVELSLRPFAEGCRTSPVAFLEGWFVAPEARRRGVGRALVVAAERWARDQGCTEFASDAHPDNAVGIQAHQALGFLDAGFVRCFRKEIPQLSGPPASRTG